MTADLAQPHLELKAPPPLAAGGLRVMALGGLGEIGRNMAVLEYDGRPLVLGFEEAARHHGGAGALYVRLRRR